MPAKKKKTAAKSAKSSASKSAKKPAAKKPAAKKAAKPSAKKAAPAKKPARKKPAAKKTAAKPAAKKAAAKVKAAVSKPAAKAAPKEAAKKASAKAAAPKAAAKPVTPAVAAAKVAKKPAASAARVLWHDLMTTDVDKAKTFYTQLLPWKTRAVELAPMGVTHRIEAGGADVGGMISLPAAEGIASHWMPYAVVTNLDSTVERARRASGYVPVPPTPLQGLGRFAVIADPRGAHISPLELKGNVKLADGRSAGQACWSEVMTDDLEQSSRFFAEVLGWDRSTNQMPSGPYTVFMAGEEMRAGASGQSELPAQWVVSFLVDDVEASTRKGQTLGGTVLRPVDTIPGMGRWSLLKDPTGAVFSLFQSGG